MKLDELIAKLQEIQAHEGNIDVGVTVAGGFIEEENIEEPIVEVVDHKKGIWRGVPSGRIVHVKG